MKIYKVTTVLPLTYTVEAENQEEAEGKALDKFDAMLLISSTTVVVHEISERHEDNEEWIELTPGLYE